MGISSRNKELKDWIWNAARATFKVKLQYWLEKITEKYPDASEWLKERPCEEWSRACFSPTAKCDILLNNLSECFNKYILEAREKPILTMMEMIRSHLMKRINSKQIWGKKIKGELCPKIKKKLSAYKNESDNYTAEFAGLARVQVSGPDGQFVVDMEKRTCACRRWDLTGIPCMHVCCCIMENNEESEKYVDACYSKATYQKIYNCVINPINGPNIWEKETNAPGIFIAPSSVKKKRGRKATARRKEAEEIEKAAADKKTKRKSVQKMKLKGKGVVTIKCSICGQLGHNKRFHKSNGNSVTSNTNDVSHFYLTLLYSSFLLK